MKLHQPSISSAAQNGDPALVSKTVGEVEKWHVELVGIRIFLFFFTFGKAFRTVLLLQFCSRVMEGVLLD